MPPNIVCGDALEILPTLGAFDYILTDPPYPTGGQSSMKSASSVLDARMMIDGMSQSMIAAAVRSVVKRRDFSIWMMCDWRQVSYYANILRGYGLDRQSCIVWDKGSGSLSGVYHPSHELVLWASNAKPTGGYLGRDVIRLPRPGKVEGRTHPFGKPPTLVQEMCKAFPPGRVVDPFCGGGGLLLGAHRLGWECVGVDISPKFCAVARDRLARELDFSKAA